jgi:DNA-binding LacI/PurR family transcriptional regulator
MEKKKKSALSQPGKVTLKQVAARVGLAPGTVSAVPNNGSSARAIPEHTR